MSASRDGVPAYTTVGHGYSIHQALSVTALPFSTSQVSTCIILQQENADDIAIKRQRSAKPPVDLQRGRRKYTGFHDKPKSFKLLKED